MKMSLDKPLDFRTIYGIQTKWVYRLNNSVHNCKDMNGSKHFQIHSLSYPDIDLFDKYDRNNPCL